MPILLRKLLCKSSSQRVLFRSSRASSSTSSYRNFLLEQYENRKDWLCSKRLPSDVDPLGVFANDNLDLGMIDVYGFDYDYTLATYKTSVETLIHQVAKDNLIDDLKYPESMRSFKYDRELVIRGLHYDVSKGVLLKLDGFVRIELGTAYLGHRRLSDEEVLELYKKRHLPTTYVEAKSGQKSEMILLADTFAKPLMCLLLDVVQWFVENGINFEPKSVFDDVSFAMKKAHPIFHKVAASNPDELLDDENNTELRSMLERLQSNGKSTFVITNSPFKIVDNGMRFMLGKDWMDFFDVIIVQARKPTFFTDDHQRTIREYSSKSDSYKWGPVTTLDQGRIYAGGTLRDLKRLTGWKGERVLYFGDHVMSDLADLSLHHGWRTGAVIQDLEDELRLTNDKNFKWNVNWSTLLSMLIEENQDLANYDKSSEETINSWKQELLSIRLSLKEQLNPRFGSVFRTERNPTYFSRRLFRFADIYTSRTVNLNKYAINHKFFPRRGVLPHEFRSWFV